MIAARTTALSPGETTALLALLLAAAIIGAGIFSRLRLPRIVGYILGGLALKLALTALAAFGALAAARLLQGNPEVLGFVRRLALAVVLFSIGLAFEIHHLRRLGRLILRVGLAQAAGALVVTFALCAAAGYLVGAEHPLVLATFCGIVAMSISPAATYLTLRQYEAKGNTTEDILTITGLSAVLAIFLFDVARLALGETGWVSIPGCGSGPGTALLKMAAATGGSLLVGVLAGMILAMLHGRTSVHQETLALLAILLGVLALGGPLGLDYLLTSLLAGVTFVNIAHDPGRLQQRLAAVGMPLFALLFALAGFALHLGAFASAATLALVLAYVAGRVVGKLGGARLAVGAREAGAGVGPGIGLGLLCHAEVAVGLIIATQRLWDQTAQPAWVRQLSAVVLGAVPLFELAGPLLLKRTVVAAGEVRAFRLFHFPAAVAGGWAEVRDAVVSLLRRLGVVPLPSPHRGPILARHVMHTSVKVLQAGAGLDEVLHFIEQSRLDHFPVVDAEGRFAGTIDLADVRDMIYAPDVRHLVTAQDLLEDESVTAGPDETLPQLFEEFHSHRASDLVVLDDQAGTILGIVEQRDVLRAMHVEQTGQPPPAGH